MNRPQALVDTNIWLLVARRRFPLQRELDRLHPEIQIVVPETVRFELEALEAREVLGARVARRLAVRYPVVRAPGRGDEAILRLARRRGAWVVTADKMFRTTLLEAGIRVLVPRSLSRLQEVGSRARRAATLGRVSPHRGNTYHPTPGR